MATHRLDSSHASEVSPWSACSQVWNPTYKAAALRAGVIALVLLGILAAIVLF
jgi:hypothetical protein